MIFHELNIFFHVSPSCILDVSTSKDSESLPGGIWLPGAILNAAENCLVPNSKKKAKDVAIIWRDEGRNDLPLNVLTFEELQRKVWYVCQKNPLYHILWSKKLVWKNFFWCFCLMFGCSYMNLY
jgi:hypothetical protein